MQTLKLKCIVYLFLFREGDNVHYSIVEQKLGTNSQTTSAVHLPSVKCNSEKIPFFCLVIEGSLTLSGSQKLDQEGVFGCCSGLCSLLISLLSNDDLHLHIQPLVASMYARTPGRRRFAKSRATSGH